ncbi:N-formylglutamate amidohydrolase [Fodinicurvata fenggangensis]|uniref:N-formylglutamate amidohydrolase n=1 Tax=Fodinicurvata fenggangensis TaxID=1121830 RepID=UPI00047D52B1|nr:N-formylglutamate amidohydrolase [Fodinicurvata fenggangensis]
MDGPAQRTDIGESHEVLRPRRQCLPLVVASPHSGSSYPADFLARSRLDPLMLRRSEDSFVDEIFAAAPGLGVPLLRALFPRAYVDPNREPYELDPSMFDEPLPDYVNSSSPRVAAGLGTVARVVANGAEIYKGKLTLDDALRRIERCYRPYHDALAGLLAETRAQFGACLLLDCHSMPSSAQNWGRDPRVPTMDIVLGDCHGSACAPEVTECATEVLRAAGYRVGRNKPYSGGYVTRHYSRPREGLHCLQIEINRRLYMDEARIERTAGLDRLAKRMPELIRHLGQLDLQGA